MRCQDPNCSHHSTGKWPPKVTFSQETVPNLQFQKQIELAKLRIALRTTVEETPEEQESDWSLIDNKDWENQPDPEWMSACSTLVPPQPEFEKSAYTRRWEESFKRCYCPHGTRIYSPEDECMSCIIECSTNIHPINHVYAVRNETQEPDPPRHLEDPQVYVQALNSMVGIPQLPHEGDAMFDLRSTKDIKLSLGEESLIPTGLKMEIPRGYCGKIESKSGLALAGLIAKAGLIDSSFRGEIMALIANQSFRDYFI